MSAMRTGNIKLWIWAGACSVFLDCNKPGNAGGNFEIPPPPPNAGITYWLTTGDKTNLLSEQKTALDFGTISNTLPVINVDSMQKFQAIDGFGYTLTSGSAQVINQLPAAEKNNLLNELFRTDGYNLGI